MSDRATDGGSLELYVYERQSSTAGSGAADRVDRLTLGPSLQPVVKVSASPFGRLRDRLLRRRSLEYL